LDGLLVAGVVKPDREHVLGRGDVVAGPEVGAVVDTIELDQLGPRHVEGEASAHARRLTPDDKGL
jgi:hypothetical protein